MRYLNALEVKANYNCDNFPFDNLIVGDTIDLVRILKLDYDLPVTPLPTRYQVFLSILLHTTHFNETISFVSEALQDLLITKNGELYEWSIDRLSVATKSNVLGIIDFIRNNDKLFFDETFLNHFIAKIESL